MRHFHPRAENHTCQHIRSVRVDGETVSRPTCILSGRRRVHITWWYGDSECNLPMSPSEFDAQNAPFVSGERQITFRYRGKWYDNTGADVNWTVVLQFSNAQEFELAKFNLL